MARNAIIPSDAFIHDVALERLQVAVQEVVSMSALRKEFAGVASNLKFESHLSHLADGMVYTMYSFLLKTPSSKIYKREMKIEVPATWFDHFVMEVMPKWFGRFYTARMKDHKAEYDYREETRMCPHVNFAWPDAQHIVFLSFSEQDYLKSRG